ncbi:N-acetyltransferase [Pseudomonas sp. ISL-88]|uniref:GNAT family N-acetyltransferase n=1 Tax=Pseudomonas sp. ISL-88 TaxID=2819169 RepID=UPI001BE669F7|nr:GNAT family N-acetyltransferase [Pseudomonas sp. ISL-88]MBT2713459.1 N-acetyltransferase [Pseudomonas sp. ISL-88]
MNLTLRRAVLEDADAVVAIYNSTIASRMVTADTEEVTTEDRMDWFLRHTDKRPLFVAEDENGKVAAWISFETFYGRPAYEKTAEISIYLHEDCRGKGAGSFLLQEALRIASEIGIRNIMAFIFGHNVPSIKLFEKFGFTQWGVLPGVAEMDGKRYDLNILGRELS